MLRALPTTLLPLILLAGAAGADVGATLSLQTDARERGVSYTGNRPGAQAGISWDGASGGYAGASLTRVRFDAVAQLQRVQLNAAASVQQASAE